MKARRKKLAMLVLTLSVLLVGAGCGEKEQVLFSAGTSSPQETDGTESTESAGGDESTGSADGAETTESADDAALTEEPAQEIFVHVCGAVQAPGVYVFAEDARICDAIEAAGGCTAQAAADSLNLAQVVSDGMRVYVPTAEEAAEASAAGDASAEENDQWVSASDADTGTAAQTDSDANGVVNLNTATKEELMTLPGIGEAKAERILTYRTEHGAFESIEEIMQINGIKESTFAEIKDKIGV